MSNESMKGESLPIQTRLGIPESNLPAFIRESGVPFRLELIRSTKAFEKLFEGFEKVRAITYVAQARSLLDLFEKFGSSDLEIILGESFTDVRGTLDSQILDRLCTKVDEGTLRVYVPRKTIHSKMYILEKPGLVRVIYGSRNLYPTSSWDSVAVFDLNPRDPIALQFVSHYEEHLEGCSLFLGDLVEQLREEPARRPELIEAYLQRGVSDEEASIQIVLLEATRQALHNPSTELLTIELPNSLPAKKEVEKVLASLNPTKTPDQITVRTEDYLGFVERTIGLPVMSVDVDQLQVRLVIGGKVRNRASPLPTDLRVVDRALDHVERYLATTDLEAASEWDREAQKAGMFEGILYVLASPFFHELMKIRRARFGLVDRRGPLFLMFFGRSSNGKTTFLQFALKLLAGEPVTPLTGKDFKPMTLDRARSMGTLYPLVFDDMSSITDRKFEAIIKSHWEKRWVETNPVSQLIFSTNTPTLHDWARTRVKKIVFPVYFQPDPSKKQALHRLLMEDNALFEWFAYLFMKRLREEPEPSSDDLATAREVMGDLYAFAGRKRPPSFLDQPVEQKFSSGRLEWHDLLYGIKKADLVQEGSRIRIEFKRDMQRDEVSYYESNLPLGLNKDRKGNTILILAPEEFMSWIGQSGIPQSMTAEMPAKTRPTLRQRLRSWRRKET